MKRVVFIGPGVTGSAHLVLALSLRQGLRRIDAPVDFYAIVSSPLLFDRASEFGVTPHLWEPEPPSNFDRKKGIDSRLAKLCLSLEPDLVLVNKHWFVAQGWLAEAGVPFWFLTWQSPQRFFEGSTFELCDDFCASEWERVLTLEPFPPCPALEGAETLPPLVLRNPAELPSREAARRRLGLTDNDERPVCLMTISGRQDEERDLVRNFSYLSDAGWNLIKASNHRDGLFPSIDVLRAVDLLVCGAGYNSYWEARWTRTPAHFYSLPRVFEDLGRRLTDAEDYIMTENGADALARRIVDRLG